MTLQLKVGMSIRSINQFENLPATVRCDNLRMSQFKVVFNNTKQLVPVNFDLMLLEIDSFYMCRNVIHKYLHNLLNGFIIYQLRIIRFCLTTKERTKYQLN